MTATDERSADPEAHDRASPIGGRLAGVAGAVSALLALGVTELAAGLVAAIPSMLVAVGDGVIDVAPPGVKDIAIALFGTADKIALQVGTVVLAAVAGGALGRGAARRFGIAVAGFAAFAIIGVLATAADPQASPWWGAVGAALGAGAGLASLHTLLRGGAPPRGEASSPGSGVDRRRFLGSALLVTVGAAASGALGRLLSDPEAVAAAAQRDDIVLPVGATRPTPPPGTTVGVDGVAPLFTPNDSFYRIDTALRIPRADLATWRLRVGGLVERELSLSYDDLLDEADLVADVTIACVSNEVGGGLVGNAQWAGVPLGRLLERAGVQPEGRQVVGRSLDGFTAGFPVDLATDGREAMVAIGMNGEPLPARHGFPARLIVPGLYGYVSATKWLDAVTLEPEGFDGYWIPRGWAKDGPIKTQSRIDVPRPRDMLTAGPVAVAGVAWAPTRGIRRVEVSVDDGPWQEARLAESLDVDVWRQWVYEWDAQQGQHRLAVRATDGDGEVQTPEEQPPAPDGATGHHTIVVDVV